MHNILTRNERFFLSLFLNFFLFLPNIDVLASFYSMCLRFRSNSLLISSSSPYEISNKKFSHLPYNSFADYSGISRKADSIIYFVSIVFASKIVKINEKKSMEHIAIIRISVLNYYKF